MNKNLYIFLFLLYLLPVSAQNNAFKKELLFGVNGGVTLSKVNFSINPSFKIPNEPQNLLRQFTGGISVRYITEKNVGLYGELNYSQRGWNEVGDPDVNPGHTYTRSLSYIELPLFTHIYINTGKRGRFIFNIGPQVSFLLSESSKDVNIILPPEYDQVPSYYSMSVQRKLDWGICGGGGFEFRPGIGSFVLEGRYYYGLSDLFSNTKADEFLASSNQVITLKLTYLFKAGK